MKTTANSPVRFGATAFFSTKSNAATDNVDHMLGLINGKAKVYESFEGPYHTHIGVANIPDELCKKECPPLAILGNITDHFVFTKRELNKDRCHALKNSFTTMVGIINKP